MDNDIQQDSGRYLQEYVQSLENLPSEIKYHWAEVLNRNETAQNLERRVHVHQHDLAKLHKQWFHPEIEKRQKIQRHEPVLVKRIQRDYDKLQDLATERIELMEGALQLVDRHLHRLGSDLDLVDIGSSHTTFTPRPQASISLSQTPRLNKRPVYDEEEDEEELDEEEEEEPYVEAVKQQQQQRQLQPPPPPSSSSSQQQHQRKKRKERDENNEEEPLYCYCRQVSFGEMVGCDGENCPYEWFHMECLGLTEPPAGKWYCNDCLAEIQRQNPNHRQTTPTRKGAAHHPQKKLKRKKEST